MKLKSLLCALALVCVNSLHADDGKFYLKVGSGASFSQKEKISAPSDFWDAAVQGYDSNLGNVAIFNAAVGYEFPCVFAVETEAAYRPSYKYRKFQTGINVDNVPNFLGNKTRTFDLDILTGMVNFYFSGRGISYLDWNCGECLPLRIYPFIGVGVGYNQLRISNFHATGLTSATCDGAAPDGFPAFTSGDDINRTHFAYQLMAGLEAKFCECFGLSVEYRWYNAGRFQGAQYIRDQCGATNQGPPWNIDFKANEILVELKVYL